MGLVYNRGWQQKHLITLRGVVLSDRLSGAYDPADTTGGMSNCAQHFKAC
jgi:hypothetical protein